MKKTICIILTLVFLVTASAAFAETETVDVTAIKIGLSKTTMNIGETQKIIVSITPTNAIVNLDYTSDNPDVITAAFGTLMANSEGTANITVTVSGTEISDTVSVTVSDDGKEAGGAEGIKPSKITIENKTIYLMRYETEKIVYTVTPEEAENKKVLFESSDTFVATVDNKGYVYAKRTGNTTITLKTEEGNVKETVKVYVSEEHDDEDDYDPTVRSVHITCDDEIVKNNLEVMETGTIRLGIKVYPSSAGKAVTWRSSDVRIATVDSKGCVTGVKKGTCTIYAASSRNSSKRDSVKIVVTDYVKYPDNISVRPEENAVFETGSSIRFYADISPVETTERDIIWKVTGGASINQSGVLQITGAGEITVKAYSKNYKTVGEYRFNAVYGKEHFVLYGQAYNLCCDRIIEMWFDAEVSLWSATANVFATTDELGNGEKINVSVKTDGKTIKVAPSAQWPIGDVYIFIKDNLTDTNGNRLGKNIKYKLNIRGNVYDKQIKISG